jgi:hypothetical protein
MIRSVCTLFLAALLLSGGAHAFTQTTPPDMTNIAWSTVTCGSTSTALPAASTYQTIRIPATAGQLVWFTWGQGVTATTATPSQDYGAGTNIVTGGGAGACIVAAGSQAISVGVK